MNDRDVLFRIGLADHPQTEQKLRGLADKVRGTMHQIGASIDSVGDKAHRIAEGIPSQTGGYERQLNRLQTARPERSGSGASASGDPGSSDWLEVMDQRVGFSQRRNRLQTQRYGGDPGGTMPAPTPTVPAPDPDATDAATEALEKQADIMERLSASGQQVESQLSGNFREIASKAEESASGVAQLASGLAFLGADSESARELVDLLLKVKGGADVALGGFKTLSGGVQVLSLLSDRTKLFAQSQAGQAQQQKALMEFSRQYVAILDREGVELKQTTNGNKKHADTLRYVAQAAERAARAEDKLATSTDRAGRAQAIANRVGRRRGGSVGAGAASVIGIIGADAITGALGGGGSIGATAQTVGGFGVDALLARGAGAAGGLATKTAGALGTTVGGSLAAVGGAAAAAVAGLAFAGKSALEFGKDINEYGWRGGASVDGWSDSIGQAEVAVVSWVGSITGAFDYIGDVAVENAQKLRQSSVADAIQEELLAKIRLIDLTSARAMRDQARGDRETVRGLRLDNGSGSAMNSALMSQRDLLRELAMTTQTIDGFSAGKVKSEELFVDALQRAQTISGQLVDNQRHQIDLLRSESDARMDMNRAAIQAGEKRLGQLDQELSTQQKIRSTAQEQLGDAAVRFANLSQREQAEALRAQKLAQSGRAGELNREQRELLRQVGTQNATGAVRQADIMDAQRAGFFGSFGAGERQRIQQAALQQQAIQAQAVQVQAEIVNRTQLNIVVERDARQISEQIIRRVEAMLARERGYTAKQREIADQKQKTLNTAQSRKDIQQRRGTEVN